jgi:membrane protein
LPQLSSLALLAVVAGMLGWAVEKYQAGPPESRGRLAASPQQIPARGWRDILLRTWNEMSKDRLSALAAAVTFYALLATFPAVTAIVSVYGLFADARTVSEHLQTLAYLLPPSSFEIIAEQATRVTGKGEGKLTIGFVLGFCFALWSANAGTKALIDALNVVYEEEEKRSFLRLNAVSLAFTLAGVGFALVAMAVVVVFPLAIDRLGLAAGASTLVAILRWPITLLVLMLALAVLYRFAPSRNEAQWKWVSPGSALAGAAWIAVSLGFSFYLSNFSNYDATYGTLGAAIGLIVWMWLSFMVILVGGELNAEMEHQTTRDTTAGAPKPMGLRGAVMADTVGRTP